MKLIGHVHGNDAYQATVGLLRSKGIPTYTKYSGAPSNWPVPYRAAIYVCLDQHYNDALALLKDPNHSVASPVDIEHFERSTRDQPTSPLILKWLLIALVVVVALFAAVLFVELQLAMTPDVRA